MAIQKRNVNGTITSAYSDKRNLRYCPGCDRFYPFDNFYKDARGANGLTRRCKQCHSRKSYISRKKRSNLVSERYDNRRKWALLKHYKITPEEFEALLKAQKGKCQICGEITNEWWTNDKNGGLHIDHHHACGRVRGLLCSACSTALGLMGDDQRKLKSAIEYLTNSDCCAGLPQDV